MSQRCHGGSAASLQNSWRVLNCSCVGGFNDNYSLFFFFCWGGISSPDALYYDTCLSRHVVSSLCGSSPASADARSGKRGLNKRKPPQTHSCIMHVYICSASCAVSWFFLSVFFSPLPLSLGSLAVIRRLPGSCGVAGGGLEGGLPHGFLLQSELRAVGSQSPRQPTCAGASQTGERD